MQFDAAPYGRAQLCFFAFQQWMMRVPLSLQVTVTAAPACICFRYVRGVRLKYWRNADTYKFQRQKVAVDLSHFQNLGRIVRENKAAVIIEDDATFNEANGDKDAWYRDLLKPLQELPQVGPSVDGCRAVSQHVTAFHGPSAMSWHVHQLMAAQKVHTAMLRASNRTCALIDGLYCPAQLECLRP
jgi:hypothetical protein